jgi:hypothetical protein
MVDRGFSRRERNGIPFYVCRALEEISDLRHGFSTRNGGVSTPSGCLNLGCVAWDTPEFVEENRRRFLSAIGAERSRLATLSQIHSDRVQIVESNCGWWSGSIEGDALATCLGGTAVAVQVADCFPILIADTRTHAVAAIHAGWRGTLTRILSKTVSALRAAYGCDPSLLLIAIGPGIRSCCYEVGQEVVDLYRQEYPGVEVASPHASRPGKYLMNLHAALSVQVCEAGIDPARVFDLGLCTCCGAHEFFSYRRDGPSSGRMMGAIVQVI